MTVSASIYNSLTISLSRFYLEMYQSMMDSFGIFFHSAFVLYFVFAGFQYLYGEKDGKDAKDIFITCLLVSSVYVLVLQSAGYFNYVIRPTFDLFTDLLTFLFGIVEKVSSQNPTATGQAAYLQEINTMTDLFTGLDMMALEFIKSCKGLLPSSWALLNPAWAVINLLAILLLIGAYLAMYCAFIFMFLLNYFMMWLLFYTGGIVLLLACFKQTRSIFWAWLKMMCNFALTAIFTAMVVAICYSGISQAVFKMSTYTTSTIDFTGDFLGLFIWCILCFAITLKSPDIAAGLTSTVAGSTSGIAGMASMAGGQAMAGSHAVGMAAGKGTLGAGVWGWNNRKDLGSAFKNIPGGATQVLKDKLGIKDPTNSR